MSLPSQTIDDLFDRLAATYGRQWFLLWDGVEAGAVKALWGHELAAFAGKRERCITWALENLPTRCPNAIEFKQLCRQAPSPDAPMLPLPKANPERMRAEFEKLAPTLTAMQSSIEAKDCLAWARAILVDVRGGIRRTPTVVAMARRALGMVET